MKSTRLLQGDLIGELKYYRKINLTDLGLSLEEIKFPYVFVMSMSCDLENSTDSSKQAFKNLFSILVCPAYPETIFYNQIHVLGLESQEKVINLYNPKNKVSSNQKKYIENNNDLRYHFIEKGTIEGLETSLVVDFKHFFTVDIFDLLVSKTENYYGQLPILHKESLTLRFANYISRIGLPDIMEESD